MKLSHNPIKKIIIVISLFFLVVSIFTFKSEYSSFLMLLEVEYIVCFCFYKKDLSFKKPGALVLIGIMFMRYIIVPTVLISSGTLNKFAKTYDNVSIAILIMAIEMICIFFVLYFYNPVIKKPYEETKEFTNRKIVVLIVLLILILIYSRNTSLIGNLSFDSTNSIVFEEVESNISGLVSIIWQTFSVFLYCSLVKILYESNINGFCKIVGSLLVTALYIVVIFTGQSSISRWYTIVTMCASCSWLMKLYPTKKKIVFISIVIPVCFFLVIASIIKNTTLGKNYSFIEGIQSLFNSTNMDTYFSGPVNINTAIEVYKYSNTSIKSIFYDLTNNLPYINHFINTNNATIKLFNAYLGRGDQILPLVGQSFMWFSYVGMPFLSMLSCIITLKLDSKFSSSKGILSFLFAFFSIWSALMLITNFTIWIAWVYVRIIPAYILFKLFSSTNKQPQTQSVSLSRNF